jgi:hypothetical protein
VIFVRALCLCCRVIYLQALQSLLLFFCKDYAIVCVSIAYSWRVGRVAADAAEGTTVAVQYDHRVVPAGLDRMEVIDSVIEHVPRPPFKVKLRGAEKTICVQVCGIPGASTYSRFFLDNTGLAFHVRTFIVTCQ